MYALYGSAIARPKDNSETLTLPGDGARPRPVQAAGRGVVRVEKYSADVPRLGPAPRPGPTGADPTGATTARGSRKEMQGDSCLSNVDDKLRAGPARALPTQGA